jgi:hypothetical protein
VPRKADCRPTSPPANIASVTDQLARARSDLASGRLWKARDRLHGILIHRQDVEVLDLLATVYHAMQDLPAAGALWFATGRDDDLAHESIAAWRERFGNDVARWQSIPAAIRRRELNANLRQLERDAADMPTEGRRAGRASPVPAPSWWEPVVFGGGAILFGLWLVTMIVIGMWTVLRWIWS